MTTRDAQSDQAPLPIGAVARELGVSVDTIREWEKKGRIQSFRTLGNQRRFLRADVVALLSGEQGDAA